MQSPRNKLTEAWDQLVVMRGSLSVENLTKVHSSQLLCTRKKMKHVLDKDCKCGLLKLGWMTLKGTLRDACLRSEQFHESFIHQGLHLLSRWDWLP